MTENALESAVQAARREIATDGYPVSIGELTTMYRDGELVIRPEFQRLFRWNERQKSRLIESILVGIPLPSVFVAQREDGRWELVDGLQRMSTILQLQGVLSDAEPLTLTATKYLPQLDGMAWESPDPERQLPGPLKLDIKRARIDVSIIKRESGVKTKFDLFQRLNSYGSKLTSQEMRSAMLVAVSPEFFGWLEGLASHPSFRNSVDLSEKQLKERYDLELVVRFLVLHMMPKSDLTLTKLRGFSELLDDRAIEMAEDWPADSVSQLGKVFVQTFDLIEGSIGGDLFRKFSVGKGQFVGRFLNTSFEVFALGVGFNLGHGIPVAKDLRAMAKALWGRSDMAQGFATGKSTEWRLSKYVPLGRTYASKAAEDSGWPVS